MRTSRKYLSIITVLLITLICMSGCRVEETSTPVHGTDAHGTDAHGTDTSADIETTTAQIESTTQDHSLLLKDAKKLIINETGLEKKFINWIEQNYDSDILFALETALKEQNYSDELWHTLTGNTITVLKDYYSGKLDTAQTAASNHIYFKDAKGIGASKEDEITLGFAGDLCLSENWPTLIHYDENEQDITKCLSENLISAIHDVDIMMLNNEFAISDRGEALPGKYYTFRALPKRIEILHKLEIDIVSLANNHCYDFGADAFYDTLDILSDAGIKYVGAGRDMDEAKQPVYYIINGIKIAYVAATRAEKYIFTPEAGEDSPGVIRTYDPEKFLAIISDAKAQSDYVIAYVHWGTEDSNQAEEYQRDLGKSYIDAGADAVIGGHPHVLQGIEYYNDKPIVYSLADFWFNYETHDTGVINLKIGPEGLRSMEFLPCTRGNCFTNLETDQTERRRIFDFMESISFGIKINDQGIVNATSN